jgi:deazaflavin-dependent oxidoreductase (nitroreductase family)
MSNSGKEPNAVTAWMYRMVPKLPRGMRPKNIIILHHTGRRSGQRRTAGLQQIYRDIGTGRYFVAAAYGSTSDWWLNVVAHPQVTIDVGGDVIDATAASVDPDEAITVMEAAFEQAPRLRDQAFKHAEVSVSDPDGIAKVVATNPLMSFQVSHQDNS